MRLVEVSLTTSEAPLPGDVARLLADAQRQVEELEDQSRASIPAFVPSDFEMAYRALVAIQAGHFAAGRRLLEWGSGIGAVTCLAVLAEFDAAGIEIELQLVEIAEQLANRFGIAAEFACGSFVPRGAERHVDSVSDVAWLSIGGPDGYAALELEPDDFDVVFAYPWPGEEHVIFELFRECASVGALLLTYHGQEGLRLHRKLRR